MSSSGNKNELLRKQDELEEASRRGDRSSLCMAHTAVQPSELIAPLLGCNTWMGTVWWANHPAWVEGLKAASRVIAAQAHRRSLPAITKQAQQSEESFGKTPATSSTPLLQLCSTSSDQRQHYKSPTAIN